MLASAIQLRSIDSASCGLTVRLPARDTNSDGDCDSADVTQIQTWIDAPVYDVHGECESGLLLTTGG